MDKENIIMFSCETAVNNELNPKKGELHNTPTSGNVWSDNAEYWGADVNPKMVMAVLTGNKSFPGVKRVLESGPDDHVYIHLDDHGVTGGLMFGPPEGTPYFSWWYKDEMDSTWLTMYRNKMYKKMMITIEACYAGSLFYDMDPSLNIFVMTASNPNETSKGIYCPPSSSQSISTAILSDGTDMTSCLGDLFTINMMNDLEAYGMSDRKITDWHREVTHRTAPINNTKLDGGSHV